MGITCFVIGVICLLLAGITFVAGTRIRPVQDPYNRSSTASARRRAMPILAALAAVIGASYIFFDSFTTIGARNVGVQTSFGRVRGNVLGPGFHWVWPVRNVEEFDGSVQTLKFYKDEHHDNGTCITVRLGNSTQACVDVTAQWNIAHPAGAQGDAAVRDLYLKYKTFDNIHDNLLIRQLQSALNEVFGTYDPLAAINADRDVPTVTTAQLQVAVKAALQRDLGAAITIDSVTVPIVHFDQPTEDRLRAFQQEKGNTRIAQQRELTAQAQAAANKALAEQPSVSSPGVQYQNCLNTINQLADKNQLHNLPPTFNCNQGGQSFTFIPTK